MLLFVCECSAVQQPLSTWAGPALVIASIYLRMVKAKNLIVSRTVFLKIPVHIHEIKCYK